MEFIGIIRIEINLLYEEIGMIRLYIRKDFLFDYII